MERISILKVLMVALGLCIIPLGGCATGRGYLTLEIPVVESQSQPNNQQVFVRSIQDNRVFEEHPRDSSIPSLGFGETNQASDEIRKRAIARKRESFGKALGDILLEEGQTVETVVRAMIEGTLRQLGYTLVSSEGSNTIVIDASIDKFWAWFTPGFWAIKLEGKIETSLKIVNREKKDQLIIRAYAINRAGSANTATWKNLFKMVLKDYTEKAELGLRNNKAL